LPDRRGRRKSRRLCEKYLISPEGRRLSLEENEIRRQLNVPTQTLHRLIASRLLRSDNRSESTYYELSHDTLVEPVLASRRTKAHVMGMLGMVSGVVLFVPFLLVLLSLPFSIRDAYVSARDTGDFVVMVIGLCFAALVTLGIVRFSASLLRDSASSMLQYERALRPSVAGPEMCWSRFVSGLSALVGAAIVALLGLLLLSLMAMIVFGPVSESVRRFARELDLDKYVDHEIAHGIGLDTLVYLVAAAATLVVGARLCRWGVYRLAGIRGRRALSATRRTDRSAVLYPASRMLLGGISLLSALMLVGSDVLKVHCENAAPGSMPGWLNEWSDMLAVDCMGGYPDGVRGDLLFDFLLLTVLLLVAMPTLRRGIVATGRLSSGLLANWRWRAPIGSSKVSQGQRRPPTTFGTGLSGAEWTSRTSPGSPDPRSRYARR
jgi:hypothetical protein